MNRKRKGLVAGFLGCLMAASLAWAAVDSESGLHIFESGQVIQAVEVNENFAVLHSRIATNTEAIEALAGLDTEIVQQILQILEEYSIEEIEQLVTLLSETEERVTVLEEKCVAVVSSVTTLETTVAEHTTQLADHESRLTDVENKTQFMSVVGTTTLFSGTNLQVVNGLGLTETTNGLGNVVVGYSEEGDFTSCYGQAPERTGSHNLVVGSNNEWTGFGSLVSGYLDRMHGNYCTMLGCGFTLDGWCRFRFRPENRGKSCVHEHDPEHEDHTD